MSAEKAVDVVRDAHPHLMGLASAAASGDEKSVKRHADALRDAIDDVEDLVLEASDE